MPEKIKVFKNCLIYKSYKNIPWHEFNQGHGLATKKSMKHLTKTSQMKKSSRLTNQKKKLSSQCPYYQKKFTANVIRTIMPSTLFLTQKKKTLKFIMIHKRLQLVSSPSNNEYKSKRVTTLDFKTCYVSVIIKIHCTGIKIDICINGTDQKPKKLICAYTDNQSLESKVKSLPPPEKRHS